MRSAICIGLCMLVLIQISHAVLQLSSNAVNWHQAQVECRRQGLRLAVIDSLAKQTELTAFITKNNRQSQYFWIAGTNLNQAVNNNQGYTWISNGQPIVYSNWSPNQPDNFKGIEHCVHVYPNGQKWNDIPCGDNYFYVCEDTRCGC